MLASEFQYVVLDTPPGLSETTLSAIDQTTDLVLSPAWTCPAYGACGRRSTCLPSWTCSRIASDHPQLRRAARGLSLADVEATIGTTVDLLLPWSKATMISVNQGVPLLQSDVHDPMAKNCATSSTASPRVEPPDTGHRARPAGTAAYEDSARDADPAPAPAPPVSTMIPRLRPAPSPSGATSAAIDRSRRYPDTTPVQPSQPANLGAAADRVASAAMR